MKKKVDHDYALVLANIPDFETEYSELEFFEHLAYEANGPALNMKI